MISLTFLRGSQRRIEGEAHQGNQYYSRLQLEDLKGELKVNLNTQRRRVHVTEDLKGELKVFWFGQGELSPGPPEDLKGELKEGKTRPPPSSRG